jgi:hypothetical protein
MVAGTLCHRRILARVPNRRPRRAGRTCNQDTKSVLPEHANESRRLYLIRPPNVVQIMELERPVPKETEVVIKGHSASVNPVDWRLMEGAPYVLRVLFELRKPTSADSGRLGHKGRTN